MEDKKIKFMSNLGYAIIFLIICIVACFKYYDVGFTWYDRIAYFGLLLGLIHFGSKAVVEYKNIKKK